MFTGLAGETPASVEESEDQTGSTSKDVIAELGRGFDMDQKVVEMRVTGLRAM